MNTKQLLAAVCPKKNNYISSFLRMLIFALHREGRGGGGGGQQGVKYIISSIKPGG